MVVVSILLHAEFGPDDYREDAVHFIKFNSTRKFVQYWKSIQKARQFVSIMIET